MKRSMQAHKEQTRCPCGEKQSASQIFLCNSLLHNAMRHEIIVFFKPCREQNVALRQHGFQNVTLIAEIRIRGNMA